MDTDARITQVQEHLLVELLRHMDSVRNSTILPEDWCASWPVITAVMATAKDVLNAIPDLVRRSALMSPITLETHRWAKAGDGELLNALMTITAIFNIDISVMDILSKHLSANPHAAGKAVPGFYIH